MARSLGNVVTEYSKRFETTAKEIGDSGEMANRAVMRLKSDTDAIVGEIGNHTRTLDDRCISLEQRMNDAIARQSDAVERLSHRHEKVSNATEQLKFDDTQRANTITGMLQKMQDFQEMIKKAGEDTHDTLDRERMQRDQQLRSLRELVNSDHEKQLQHLEARIAQRLERESTAREESVAYVLNNVSSVLETKIPMPKIQDAIDPLSASSQMVGLEEDQGVGHGSLSVVSVGGASDKTHPAHSQKAVTHVANVGPPLSARGSRAGNYGYATSLPVASATSPRFLGATGGPYMPSSGPYSSGIPSGVPPATPRGGSMTLRQPIYR
eukprot:gnl/TRDRNA2_/TRDRNA2_92507_c0_seq1.p1 gnl/TRDRNA2_/TRDRNA2_92507_c0~~gnl/TRDRNA2_/TRDRNA2_92507_c0_seq1.p1  ORF type:complete len:358 (+),score=57.16 gnl/TRDRNA2_/TRDRNA2_92507_c0_seq1:103-1074(+)